MKEHAITKLRQLLEDGYTYPKAGENAQPEVKQAIQRFRKLPLAKRQKQPLLYWLTGESTPDLKMSRLDSAYQEKPKGKQKCGNCLYAYKVVTEDRYICSQISNDIKPEAWCRLWEKG